MAQLFIEVDTTDADETLAELSERTTGILTTRSGVGKIMSEALVEYVDDVYKTGHSGKWAKLDPATVKAKRSRRVLVDTGELLKNLSKPQARGDAVIATAGSSFYASFLKDGARGTPKRDPAPEPPHDFVQDVAAEVAAFVVDGVWP
jgi:hypothetical protein